MTKKRTAILIVKKFVVPVAIVTAGVLIAKALDNKTTVVIED